MDLFARKIISRSMSDKKLGLASHYGRLLSTKAKATSISRSGNCHDNAVAESFFSNLKKKKIRRRIYSKLAEAKQVVFHYIKMVYNPTRRHTKMIEYRQTTFCVKFFKRVEGV